MASKREGSSACWMQKTSKNNAEQVGAVTNRVKMLTFLIGCQHVMEVLFPFHGLGSKLTISVLKIYKLILIIKLFLD
jgi:hypothetical protein